MKRFTSLACIAIGIIAFPLIIFAAQVQRAPGSQPPSVQPMHPTQQRMVIIKKQLNAPATPSSNPLFTGDFCGPFYTNWMVNWPQKSTERLTPQQTSEFFQCQERAGDKFAVECVSMLMPFTQNVDEEKLRRACIDKLKPVIMWGSNVYKCSIRIPDANPDDGFDAMQNKQLKCLPGFTPSFDPQKWPQDCDKNGVECYGYECIGNQLPPICAEGTKELELTDLEKGFGIGACCVLDQ